MAYSFEMVIVGMILLSAMAAGAVAVRIKRRREAGPAESPGDKTDSEASDNSEDAPQ